jgi:hypothetical protein
MHWQRHLERRPIHGQNTLSVSRCPDARGHRQARVEPHRHPWGLRRHSSHPSRAGIPASSLHRSLHQGHDQAAATVDTRAHPHALPSSRVSAQAAPARCHPPWDSVYPVPGRFVGGRCAGGTQPLTMSHFFPAFKATGPSPGAWRRFHHRSVHRSFISSELLPLLLLVVALGKRARGLFLHGQTHDRANILDEERTRA